MFKKYFKEQKGLTLMEALIGISLFLVVFSAFLISCNMATRYIRETTQRLSAVYLCQEKIEEYKAKEYRDIPLEGEEETVTIDEGPKDSVDDDLTGERDVVISSWQDEGVTVGKIITVTVSWTTIGGDHKQELTTGMCDPY